MYQEIPKMVASSGDSETQCDSGIVRIKPFPLVRAKTHPGLDFSNTYQMEVRQHSDTSAPARPTESWTRHDSHSARTGRSWREICYEMRLTKGKAQGAFSSLPKTRSQLAQNQMILV